MSVLKAIGAAARDITSIARAARNVGKLADDVKARREAAVEAIGPAELVASVKQEFTAFKLKVVERLRLSGLTSTEICNVTDLSALEVKRMFADLDKTKKLAAKPGVEEDIPF